MCFNLIPLFQTLCEIVVQRDLLVPAYSGSREAHDPMAVVDALGRLWICLAMKDLRGKFTSMLVVELQSFLLHCCRSSFVTQYQVYFLIAADKDVQGTVSGDWQLFPNSKACMHGKQQLQASISAESPSPWFIFRAGLNLSSFLKLFKQDETQSISLPG